MIKENQRLLNWLLKLADVSIAILVMPVAYYIRFDLLFGRPGIGPGYYMQLLVVILPLYLLLYYQFNLYDPFRYKSLLSEVRRVVQANTVGLVLIFVLNFFLREVDVSRLTIVIFSALNTTLTSLIRVSLRKTLRVLREKGYNIKHLLLVGWNESTGDFFDRITANKQFGYQIEGYLSDKVRQVGNRSILYKGTISHLAGLLDQEEIDEVIISLDYDEFPLLAEIIEVCENEGVKSNLLPFYTKYLPSKPYIDDIDGLPLINIRHIPLDNFLYSFLKRAFDIVASALGLVVLSPLLLVTAVGVRLTSPGPVIYKQLRVGRNKKEFMMYKFRSMRVDGNADMTTWGGRADSRRTAFGTFIRKCSIDELPQLFNVLKGDMSLVGPRPEREYFVQKFREEVPLYMLKHLVRPGITGWAQVNGWRGDTSIVERIKCDIYYIENWSFLLDLKILIMTVFKGIINPEEEL
ncbi:MAG: undecaprenyl-phosphate glucose phosphotransferase [Anaerotruncus sp.]|jgi:Undecaprenyl-phosphate glucose phosphotransferase|nr:undecaprenyl-phosphate glucose phosphotransferase [Anaerotruncus sp.]